MFFVCLKSVLCVVEFSRVCVCGFCKFEMKKFIKNMKMEMNEEKKEKMPLMASNKPSTASDGYVGQMVFFWFYLMRGPRDPMHIFFYIIN